MGRTLNVEKLEKKFASLTRSRESIQGLSSWIMHHKEFCQDIVDGWLAALKREDFNALNMFYVANDVIQHCGKKKVPEYRTAFSTVLEKAVSLAKVKEIKSEVTRMLTLWHEKEIYDDQFFKLLESALDSEAPVLEISEEEKELSESEIVSTFRLQNLIEAIENLKRIVEEVNCKEAKFRTMKCPEILNVDDLIVRMDKRDTHRQYRKADAYHKYADDLVASFILLNEAREEVLKHLGHTTIFYTAQNEEVKKVVHAYRIYGKKLKIMEKSLSEKMVVLRESFPSPIPNSPSSTSSLPFDSPVSSLNPELEATVDSSQYSQSPSIECTEEMDQRFSFADESPAESVESTETAQPKHAVSVAADEDAESNDVAVSETLVRSSSGTSEAKDLDSGVKDSEGNEDVDFLLEKAYDEQQVKRANIKRKIENLLKAKGNKTIKVSADIERGDQKEIEQPKRPTEAATPERTGAVDIPLTTESVTDDEKMQTPDQQNTDEPTDEVALQADDASNSGVAETVGQTESSEEGADTCDKNNVTKISVPTPQSISNIPLEFLKSILDKNILNVFSQGTTSQKEEGTTFRKEEGTISRKEEDDGQSDDKLHSEESAIDPTTVPSHGEHPGAEPKVDESVVKSESAQYVQAECDPNEEVPKIKEENQSPDDITTKTFEKSKTLPKSETKTMDNENLTGDEQKNVSAIVKDEMKIDAPKPSHFLETLQTTLKSFTAHSISSAKSERTEGKIPKNAFSDLPFENSLRMYSFLMQCHETIKNQKNFTGGLILNETMDSGNSDYCKVAPQNMSDHNESSKHDNLELMDMEVDSGDDS